MQFWNSLWSFNSHLLGWSGIKPDLQLQINRLLDSLPDSLCNQRISIRRIATWRLLFVVFPIFALLGWVMGTKADSDVSAWIFGACVFGAAYLLAVFRSYPKRLELDSRGVCFVCANHEINCPWTLFAERGEPVSEGMILLVPINSDAVDDVVMSRRGVMVDRGRHIQVDYLKFLDNNQLRVISNLEASPQLLGMLLQELAFALTEAESTEAIIPRQLQGQQANQLPLQRARCEQDDFEIVLRGAIQEITLPRTRLRFPPECCVCGQLTTEVTWIEACGRRMVSRLKPSVDFAIPCCRNCRKSETVRAWLGGFLSAATIVAGAAVISFAVLGAPTGKWSVFLTLVGIIAVFPMKQALDFGRRMLLRTTATYVWKSESVQLRFRQPGYALRIREYLNH